MDVYVMKDGKRQGPYQPFLLKEMLDEGELTPLDTVWHEGMEKWQPLGETDSLRSVLKRERPAPVKEQDEPVQAPRSAGVKTQVVPLELTLAVLRERRALGWRRFFARQIDMSIAVVAVVAGASALGWTDMWALISPNLWVIILAPALLWIPVEAAMLAALGWTPGRLALAIRVVDLEGNRPAFLAALKRSVLVWAAGLGFGLPMGMLLPLAQWLYSFWHLQRFGSTLWDHSAGTRVTCRKLEFRHVGGIALFNVAMASLAAWLVFTVPLPSRFTDEEREKIESMREAVWKTASPAPRNSGLPSPPGA
jgi:uncharacterized RDD family membrane protein YckC